MADSKPKIPQDEIDEVLENIIDKNEQKNGKLSDDEISELLEKINDKDFSADYDDSNLYRKIYVMDFMHPCSLSFKQIEKLKKIFYNITEYFEKDFFKITNKQIVCELNSKETRPDSIYWFKQQLESPNYIREILIGDEQVILQIDPIIINKILMDRENNNEITLVSKRIANQYIFNLIKDYLKNISMSEVTEQDYSNTVYTTTSQFIQPDNIIENPRYVLNAYYDNNSTFKFSIKCVYKDITGYIRIEMSDRACLKFLGESRGIYCPGIFDDSYYEDYNSYVSMGLTALSDEHIQDIREGDTLIFNKYLTESLDLIYNGKKIANSEGVLVEYDNGIRITEVLDEKDRYSYPTGRYNSFIVFGCKNLSSEDLKYMGEGTIFELNSMIGDYFPLVCNNKIVAFGSIDETDFLFTLKITGVLKNPIPFIKYDSEKLNNNI